MLITLGGGRFAGGDAHLRSRLVPMKEPSEAKRSDAQFRTRAGAPLVSEQPIAGLSKSAQVITARVMSECRRTYGATIDDSTLQSWVNSVLGTLLNEQTRVTQFVPVLAMRDIRERANKYVSEAA